MTSSELSERHAADTRAAKLALENGVIDNFEFEATIERIDNKFFDDLEFLHTSTPMVEFEHLFAAA